MLSLDRHVLSTKAVEWLDLLAEHSERKQKSREEDLHWTATVNL
jgi:hypothetical protein